MPELCWQVPDIISEEIYYAASPGRKTGGDISRSIISPQGGAPRATAGHSEADRHGDVYSYLHALCGIRAVVKTV